MIKILFSKSLTLIVCLIFSVTSFAQQRTITGIVSDDNGVPLSGATILVKKTKNITTTNSKGAFTLNAPSNTNTLVVTYVGMSSKEIIIGSDNSINVSLVPASGTLSDIVIVGYGKTRKADLTTAQTTISAKDIDKTVNTTLEQAIQGRSAGVYVTQNSGQPGGGISVNIRGVSSLSRTQPLYVIDGIQIQGNEDVSFGSSSTSNALAGLNPQDIEDMQILQGPSATAIYGSRATNGVILITTKRGKAGDFKINYSFQYNQQLAPKHLPVMNLQQYAQMVKEYHTIAGGTTPAEFLDPSLLGAGTDWQRELFNKAAMKKHQLNLSGGNSNTTYYMSGEYLDQAGIAAGSGFKRHGFRLNLDNKPRSWATIGVNVNFSQTNENLAATNYGDAQSPLIANALRLTPQIPVVNLNGTWGGSDPVNGAGQYAPTNPIALASLITNNNMKRNLTGGINIGITPFKGLSFRTSFNAAIGSGFSLYYTPTYNLDQWHNNQIASLANASYQSWYYNWNQLVEYTREFGKHKATIMASHETQGSEYQALSVGRTGFLTNDIYDVNAGDSKSATNGGGTYPGAQESYLGRFNYGYDNRYLITATYRRDGSPNFGADKRWGGFPSFSAAWRVNNEKFFKIPAISDLKLRYEYGFTGNQGTNTSAVFATMNNYLTGLGSGVTGFLPSNFTNPLFQWEDTKTSNIGLNLGLFKNRITIEADYFVRNTKNLILGANLPWYMGTNGVGAVAPPQVNAGALNTKGWNLTFNTINVESKDFRWESNFNLSHFKTIVDQLYQETPFISRTSWWMNNWTQRTYVNNQPWLFMGYIQEGIFQSTEEIEKSAVPVDGAGNRVPVNEQTGLWVGDVKYKDINGDGKIDQNDFTVLGNPWPKLSGGFTNSFSYKGFDLSILLIGTFGNDVYNYIAAEASNPNNINLSRNLMVNAMSYAKVSTDGSGKPVLLNPGTTVPRISTNSISSDNNFGKITNAFMEDGSYLRLKNISLSYNLSSKILGYIKVIKSLRATVGVQNIYTWTKYKGFDPEIGSYVGTGAQGNNQASGIDFGRYPLTPMVSATINVNF